MSDPDNPPFEGTFDALLTYHGDKPTLRVVSGFDRRHDWVHNRDMHWKLTAALESRPE